MTFEEHESLLRLEQAVFKDIEEYVKTDAENFTRSQKLESSVHDTLAKIRALMRDLELLVEEVDT